MAKTEKNSERDQLISGHRYDGIREYDNPMPGWWVWIFIGGIVFSIYYVIAFYGFDAIDSYTDDLNQSLTELQQVRDAHAAENPSTIDEATLASLVDSPESVAQGATLYSQQCAVCHGAQGQGVIGPNLTDNYFIHGSTNVDMYNIISVGVLDKGMPPWDGVYTENERAQLVAFILSLYGTNPAGAKAPQGEEAPQG